MASFVESTGTFSNIIHMNTPLDSVYFYGDASYGYLSYIYTVSQILDIDDMLNWETGF